jgi:hypothetical protein
MGEVALLIGVGLALGLGMALAATRLVASFLFGVTPNDPLTLALAVVLLAGWLPWPAISGASGVPPGATDSPS